jgi:crotonobetainyl-CoA:carnitine CoA-transferase CaiB-like acyl-CoA transferase
VALTSYYGLEAMAQGRDPVRYGNAHPSIVPYGVFQAGDGPIVLTVGNNGQYRRLCEQVLERPDLCTDPRFTTNLDRSRHRADFVPVLEAELSRWTRAELLVRLSAAGIPCGEVLGLHEALTSDRAGTAGLVIPPGDARQAGGGAHVFAPPYRLDGARLPVRKPPPSLDDGRTAILASLSAGSN